MEETERFFREMGEDFDRCFRHYPPKISLDGWWWKQYIPYFRRMRKVCQEIIETKWQQDHEEVEHILKRIEKEESYKMTAYL